MGPQRPVHIDEVRERSKRAGESERSKGVGEAKAREAREGCKRGPFGIRTVCPGPCPAMPRRT